MRKLLLLTLFCGCLACFVLAQQPPSKQAPTPPVDLLSQPRRPAEISVTVQQATATVLVYDHRHNYVSGLTPDRFRLYDNGKEQNLTSVDVSYTPISLMVAVQA